MMHLSLLDSKIGPVITQTFQQILILIYDLGFLHFTNWQNDIAVRVLLSQNHRTAGVRIPTNIFGR